MTELRNIAIIAHVDHGKTTLVDGLLKQSGTLCSTDATERMMDSNQLEKERGITILSKVTAIKWKQHRINIVDTPGHADFGGEVERILSMVDAVLLLVDAVDGPMPQTRFVTQKAFANNLCPIVVVNKVDRPGARPDWAVDQVFDLFVSLDANDEQLDFPIVYTSALQGFATLDLKQPNDNLSPLLDLVVDHVPAPQVDKTGPFQMQVSAIDYNSYVGAISIGRIQRGSVQTNMPVVVLHPDGSSRKAKVQQIYTHMGLDRQLCDQAEAGDIVCITGVDYPKISEVLCHIDSPETMPQLSVDEPTIHMLFCVNNSPFSGKDGKFLTSRQIKDRLERECIHNVALRVQQMPDADKFKVSGRGELHLAILIENMRREGYELAVSRPEVIERQIDGQVCEPFEQLVLDIETQHQGSVMEALGLRKATLENMTLHEDRVTLHFIIATRALIGFYSQFLTMTSGSGIMSHVFFEYAPKLPVSLAPRPQGVLIANASGTAMAYALFNLQSRGRMFIAPQTDVYEGMVIGIHTRSNDLVVNVQRAKQLTNVRAEGKDDNILLTPPINLTLEYALEFIEDDELVEVTPNYIRLRKRYLKEHERKRHKKS
ncbi:MAG: translational GTPase TypA [Legionellales bacterium]|nr:translational GTPase TypA [Legionellales bacterium]